MKPVILIVTMMLCLSFPLMAQDIELSMHPGYIDLDQIQIPDNAADVTEVDIGPGLINMIRQFSGENEEVKKKMEGFFSIRVKSFDIDEKSTEAIRPIINDIEKKLKKEKWEKLVRVKEGEEVTNVSIKYSDKGKMQGLLVMSLEPNVEASFVNIVGSIDFDMLGDLGVDIDASAMDSLKQTIKNKK